MSEANSDFRRGDQFDLYALPDGLTQDEEKTRDLILAIASSRDSKAVNMREAMEIYERVEGKTPAILAMARMLNRTHSGIEGMLAQQYWATKKADKRDDEIGNVNSKKVREGLVKTYAN